MAIWHLFARNFMHSLWLEILEQLTHNQQIHMKIKRILIMTLSLKKLFITF